MRLILYARKSTESEDRQVQSIDDQVRLCKEEADRHGFTVLTAITEARSAKAQGTRPGFNDAIRLVETGAADGILAWNPDRLARNAVDGGWVLDLLDRKKMKRLHFVTYSFEDTPEGKMMLSMIFTQAKYQVDKLSRDVLRGMDSKREKGWFPHRAPEGYFNDRNTHTVVPDPERFPLLRRAWEAALTGAYTGTQVCALLEEWGYRTRQGGKPLARSAVYKMLSNPFYAGRFRSGGSWYNGAHQPMVSEAEFLRVQEVLRRRTPEGGAALKAKPQKRPLAYAGLIRCGACGCQVTAETKVKRYPRTGRTAAYTYYRCTGNRGCRKVGMTPAFIEAEIESLLERCRIAPAFREFAAGALRDGQARVDAADEAATAQQAKAVADAERRRDRLVRLRLDGEIGGEEFARLKAPADAEVERARGAARLAEQRREQERQTLENLAAFGEGAYERFTRGDHFARREVAVMLGASYVLTLVNGRPNLEIVPHPLLDKLRTFEPVERGFHKGKSASGEADFPRWQRVIDSLVNLLRESDGTLIFPKLPCATDGLDLESQAVDQLRLF